MFLPSSLLTSHPWRSLIGCALATWTASVALQDRALAVTRTSDLHRDEEIVFFPSLAHRVRGGSGWECEIRGCVYEPEKRRLIVGLLHETLEFKDVELTDAEAAIFAERTRLFMVDNQRGRTIVVRVGEHEHALGKSRSDGQFSGVIRLTDAEVGTTGTRTAQIQALLAGDSRRFLGQINLAEDSGISVISDIDDTIKVTQVQDRKLLLRRTFLEPFKPVPGMAEVYRAWADKSGAQFSYVSASPWQLFLPLSEFVKSNGFPNGAFYLRKFRWKDQSFLSLFESPERYKPAAIEPLLKQFPRLQFILVGDAGERDPEIYAGLARRYPQQIARILIRDVTGEAADSERYPTAFRGLPPGLWQVFRAPAEILDSCPPRPGG
jgi:Phosphatidate phosphatase APP1, catalytic domain